MSIRVPFVLIAEGAEIRRFYVNIEHHHSNQMKLYVNPQIMPKKAKICTF